MKKVLLIICSVCIAGGAYGATETCVKTAFNVTYTCNGGTLAGTLPVDQIAGYGQGFIPTAITESMCTPPDGHIYAGQAIIVDGKTVASYASASSASFTYYYTTDIEIGPHWVPVADPAVLATNIYDTCRTSTYEATAMTWTVDFWYGGVSGIAKCSSVKPANIALGDYTGLIATDQDAIENDTTAGQYCYCKMTQPEIPGSPWVFRSDRGLVSTCAPACAEQCRTAVRDSSVSGKRFRASVFAAAE